MLKKGHYISGIVIAVFLLLHLTNHLFALGGVDMHIKVMNLFRHIYRFPPVEIILMLAIAFQIISGIVLVFKKGFLRQPYYVIIQILSGLYLSFFMIYHVRAVLLGRYQWKMDTNFYFAAGVANRYPEKLFFIPYYTMSLVCIFAHIACVHYTKRMEQWTVITSADLSASTKRRYHSETIAICASGALITLLIMLALTGVLYPINF